MASNHSNNASSSSSSSATPPPTTELPRGVKNNSHHPSPIISPPRSRATSPSRSHQVASRLGHLAASALRIHLDEEETLENRVTRGESIVSQVSNDGIGGGGGGGDGVKRRDGGAGGAGGAQSGGGGGGGRNQAAILEGRENHETDLNREEISPDVSRQLGHGGGGFSPGGGLGIGDGGYYNTVYDNIRPPAYLNDDPGVVDWIKGIWPNWNQVGQFGLSFFPFVSWLPRYNTTWFTGDMIAGITIGAVVVPQGMAYAKLAELPPEYGLYSSFVGVLIYWAFATSKDITIGPVAVMSTLVGNIINKTLDKHPELTAPQIASSMAVILGCIVFVLGFARLGFIVNFIPLPAIAAFMTGSAISIAVGQIPTLMGITGFDTRAATYEVVINILKHLGRSDLNAAMGLTSLFLLYLIRWFCTFMAKRQPHRERFWFFANCIRTVFVILLYTLISWLVNRDRKSDPAFSVLKKVPRGFKHMGPPKITEQVIKAIAPELPAGTIVLLIEHIAISKSFGRVNNYTINPSQELVALGITNIFGPFFGSYPATGSFSRTAIKSKAGVRTPAAGVITAVVVLLALYALPPVFFYISNANLAAVIIHAVLDLIVSPDTLYSFWRVSPLEVFIFLAGVIVTVFSTIENGIYVTICLSAGLFLFRIAKAHGDFLGRVRIRTYNDNDVRYVYVPLDKSDGSNPLTHVESPHPGVFVYRFTESPIYPNINHYTDAFIQYITANCKRTDPFSYPTAGSRPWNDPGPKKSDTKAAIQDSRPTLKAVILDFSSVASVDVTSIQNLVDVRKQLDRFASPNVVEWHFASIRSSWTRRALASVGFGRASGTPKPMFSVADVGNILGSEHQDDEERRKRVGEDGLEEGIPRHVVPISSTDRPWFHPDLDEALRSVLNNLDYDETSSVGKLSPRPSHADVDSDTKEYPHEKPEDE